jgi:rhodanese-related sulfurtransferase
VDDSAVPNVSAQRARELVDGGALLLDVREEHEWSAGHAPDAVHLPMSMLGERVGELRPDHPIVCVCHVGARSAAVTAALNRAGWQAVNLDGGMVAWAAAGLPVVDDVGRPGIVV